MYCMYCGKELTHIEGTLYKCDPCDATFDIDVTTENGESTMIIEDISEE